MSGFEITLKNNRAETEILTTRALLAVAGVASFVYAGEGNYYSAAGIGLFLLLLSFFVKTILDRYKLNRLLLLGIAALCTYITTGSIAFAVILLVEGIFFQMLNKKVKVEINKNAITVHFVFYKKVHDWAAVSNVILKDGIFSLDFKDDHILQSEIAPESSGIDEKKFNDFCIMKLQDSVNLQAAVN